MNIAETENKRIVKEIESRRVLYSQILNDRKEGYELDDQNTSIDAPISLKEASPNKNYAEIYKNSLLFLDADEKSALFEALNSLTISDDEKLHIKIKQHIVKIKTWKQKYQSDSDTSIIRNPRYRIPEEKPFLHEDVSELSLPRVYKILSALFKCIESLGGSVNDDLTLNIRNEIVKYTIIETKEKVPHVLTKKEQKAMEEYEKDKINKIYAYKPNITKWDYIFNGKLRFSVLENSHYRDGANTLIEQRLPEIMIDLYEESENVRIKREAQEAAQRKIEEEKLICEHYREMYNEEVEKVISLENEAEDYALACKIRAYASAMESQSELTEETKQRIEWIKEKADWYDPLIAKEDPLLGKRKHKNDKESKKPQKKYSSFW